MYNGIGLDTARGSGTNGYVQRNVAFIRHHKDRVDYKSEEEMKKLDQMLNKGPNQEILNHDRKRKVELKCLEMQELMEEQGYSTEEIEKKVAIFRKMLTDKEGVTENAIDRDEAGRPTAKETHQIAEAAAEKTQQLRAAFGLSEYYQDGSSFDPNRRAKEKELEAKAMAEKQYAIVKSSSSSRSPSPVPKKKKKKARSETPSPSRSKKKKSKKQKRERSESPKAKERGKHKKKKKQRTPSPSESDSNSDSGSHSHSTCSPPSGLQTKKKSTGIEGGQKNGIQLESLNVGAVTKNGYKATPAERSTTPIHNTNLQSKSPQEPSKTVKSKHSRSKTPKWSRSPTPARRRRSYSRCRSSSTSRSYYTSSSSRSWSRSPRKRRSKKSRKRRSYTRSRSRRRSYSRSRSRSRSPSIRRRSGSPSHLDRRRITRSHDSYKDRRSYSRSSSSSARSSRSRSRSYGGRY